MSTEPISVIADLRFLEKVEINPCFKESLETAVSLLESMGWRDIESAPKDATEILLFAPEQEFADETTPIRVTSGAWIESRGDDEEDDYSGWGSWDGGFTEENPPTLWMPLPPPPITTAMKKEA